VVATLLRIRFRILGNTLSRSPWQLVVFVLTTLWAAGLLLLVAVGLFFAGTAGVEFARYAIIAGGGILTLGWALLPVLAAGVDTTLDPAKLAPFPMTTGRMMIAIAVAGVTGIPGLATLLGGLATFATWWRWPLALVAAVVCVPLGVAICVVASRTVASLASGFGGRRRVQETIGLLVFVLLLFASPIFLGLGQLVRAGAESGAQLTGILEAVSWTPIAAAWAVPGDIAAGSPLPALVKALLAVATLALLWLLWRRSLAAALVSPARSTARRARAGSLGWVGRLPTGSIGATWARSLTYWLRDVRYLQQLLLTPFIPILVLIYSGGDLTSPFFAGSAIGSAFFVGIAPYAIISYEGTAFATVLQTGIRGVADRLGRMLAAASVALPLVLLACIVTVGLAGRWEALAAVIGASIGMLLTAYGVCAVSSALLVIPVPGAGDNPFKRVPGATFTMGLAFMGLWLVAGILAAPEIVLAILALTVGGELFTWLALAVGLVLGLVLCAGGILIGGRIFDRNAPALLARLKSYQGA
jgi:ABC-2 type transport system permease protein